jgi:hypothetical protein
MKSKGLEPWIHSKVRGRWWGSSYHPNSWKESKKNSSKAANEKLGKNTLKITKKKNDPYNLETNNKKEKWSIQLGDEIHTQRSVILRESNVYKVWKPPQQPPTLWRIEGISYFISSPLLHHEAHPNLSKSNYG